MPSATLEIPAAGRRLTIELPPPSDRPSVFAFGLYKAGSTLLENVVTQMAGARGDAVVNIPSQTFGQGFVAGELPRETLAALLMRDGYVFTGFRELFDYVPTEALKGRRKVLLVRDPRDILVSLYFSLRDSHVLPEQGAARDSMLALRRESSSTDINDFVLSARARYIIGLYRAYVGVLASDWTVFRYEDIVFSKRRWLRQLADALDLPLPTAALNVIADRNDIIPHTEQIGAHIRQVRPENYKARLRPDTISALSAEVSDVLSRFGYR